MIEEPVNKDIIQKNLLNNLLTVRFTEIRRFSQKIAYSFTSLPNTLDILF